MISFAVTVCEPAAIESVVSVLAAAPSTDTSSAFAMPSGRPEISIVSVPFPAVEHSPASSPAGGGVTPESGVVVEEDELPQPATTERRRRERQVFRMGGLTDAVPHRYVIRLRDETGEIHPSWRR